MYGFVQLGDVAIPAGAPAVVAQFNVRVEEENMVVELLLDGSIVGGAAADIVLAKFQVGTATAVPALPMGVGVAAGPAVEHCALKQVVELPKGQHVVKLLLGATAADLVLKGATYDCKFACLRTTADATLGQGVNSKVQLAL